jgi:hypothetical protein
VIRGSDGCCEGQGTGVVLPPYFKPTPSVVSASNFFPIVEELRPAEMRISFIGTCPFPPKRNQAATCIMVELGNGDRFSFDFGPGCPARRRSAELRPAPAFRSRERTDDVPGEPAKREVCRR